MITKLARRLGLRPSVPASIVDAWINAQPTTNPVELAPRGRPAAFLVDEFARIQPIDATWSLELTLAAGARWVAASESERITQRLVGAGVIETTIETPAGSVVHRVGAAVAGGEPVAIVEVENAGGVAIGIGLVVRPLVHGGRGYVRHAAVTADRIHVDGRVAVRYARVPAATKAVSGTDGDVLQHMPEPSAGSPRAETSCRSGGAQAAAVWPLAHTATLQAVVDLAGPRDPNASVPTLAEVNRGWQAHLQLGMRVDVDSTEVADGLAAAGRILLTGAPRPDVAPLVVRALSEMGLAEEAVRAFPALERTDDDVAALHAVSRWFQLAAHADRLDQLDTVLGVTARAAQTWAAARSPVPALAWFDAAKTTLRSGLHAIGQPDVGARVIGIETRPAATNPATEIFAELTTSHDARWSWGPTTLASAARYVSTVRRLVVDDSGPELRLLPELPVSWRGRTIDVLGVPISGGTVSYGLRWHGPRPALLWEVDLIDDDAPVELSVPGLDPDFVTTERAGEALLADPGWT